MRSNQFSRFVFRKRLALICAIVSILPISAACAERLAAVSVVPGGITLNAVGPGVSSMMLRVVDPKGEMIFDMSTEGEPIHWTPSPGAMDGVYSYEARVGKEKKKSGRSDKEQTGARVRPWVTSGSVYVLGGAIILPTEEEAPAIEQKSSGIGKRIWTILLDLIVPSASADVLHYDDVVITGSLCVGFDCVDGESFGFDTIRLRENNLQIAFDDTSTTVGFPANDWRIQINDSVSGGGSYFTIWDQTALRRPFTIEAGAPANALYVDDGGRVGIGTSLPVLDIHVLSGDTPAWRLDQDTSSGWAAQIWDVAGNEANFFIRDVTAGSKLPLRIQPGTPTSTLTLRGDGKVGMGTWSPEASVELERTGADAEFLAQRTDGASGIVLAAADRVVIGSKSDHPLTLVANNTQVMTIDKTGNAVIAGNLELGSSREIKQNIQTVETQEAIYALNTLRPVKFNYKNHPTEEVLGFVAEEVPDLVATESRRTTSPMDVVAVLTRVVQEQQKTIGELSRKIAELETGMKMSSAKR